MGWLHVIVLGAASAATMRTAIERGDLEEAARQGALAGPAVVKQALGATDRLTRLAAIAAAPLVEDRAELLPALARVAAGPDRRTAIPAAGAARTIARELANHERPDDLAEDDIAAWRAAWAQLAMRGDRWIELRVLALDTAAALDHAGIGVDLAAALSDPDPAFRRAAASVVPLPAPTAMYAPLAGAVTSDRDPAVALGAAQSLCLSIDSQSGPQSNPRPILEALGAAGLARLRALVTEGSGSIAAKGPRDSLARGNPRGVSDGRPAAAAEVRDAARCLAADGSAESAGALRALRSAPR